MVTGGGPEIVDDGDGDADGNTKVRTGDTKEGGGGIGELVSCNEIEAGVTIDCVSIGALGSNDDSPVMISSGFCVGDGLGDAL